MSARKDGTGDFASFGAGMDEDSTIDRRAARVRGGFWGKFRKVAGFIPFAEDLLAAYYCAMDTATPIKVRATLLGALAYFILPIDIVPDFIAGLGFTDDAAVLAAAISMVTQHVMPRHRAAAQQALGKDMTGEGEDVSTA